VPRIYGHLITNLVDVDRVEVLKGAQGGLYGRNATGGVINVITRQPTTDAISGDSLIDYGEYHSVRAAGFINLPLNDKIALFLSGERDSHDPFIKNVAIDNPYTAAMFPGGSYFGTPAQTAARLNSALDVPGGIANQDLWVGDGKLLIMPTSNFKITLAADYHDKQDSDGNQQYQPNPAYAQGVLSSYLGLFVGATPNLPPGFLKSSGLFQVAAPDPERSDLVDWGTSATAVWSLPGVDLTAISAYRANRSDFYSEFYAYSVPAVQGGAIDDKWYTYNELRAVSTGSGPFHFLGGASLLDNHFNEFEQIYLVPPAYTVPAARSLDVVHNWSAYLQLGYDITNKLNLTVSGRYVHETNNMNFYTPDAVIDSTERKFLPAATLSYGLGDGNVYARFAEGWKAGGVNPNNAASIYPSPQDGEVFGPETVDTFEVGYRQALFDRRVQLTTALFYNRILGEQAGIEPSAAFAAEGATTVITNVGKERTWGAEASINYLIAAPLTLGINVAYLNAKYVDYVIPPDNPIFAPVDRDGQQMINSPMLQGTATANLNLPITSRFNLVGSLLESFMDKIIYQYTAVPGVLPDAIQPAYWITNLRIGVRTSDAKYGFSVYGNNIFDRGYYTSGQTSATGNFFQWGNPRVIGGEFTAKF